MASIIPAPPPPATQSAQRLAAARQHCRTLARSHYENFTVASFLIPRHLREDFYAIYAYCRHSDDLGDESDSPAAATAALSDWRAQLVDTLAGKPAEHPILIALADTLARRNLSPVPLLDLLTAFERDQSQGRYETQADLLSYCRCSANPVGRLLLELADVETLEAIRHGDSLCTGLQLINFCQDMKRDAAIDRIYMPREIYEPYGVTEAMILAGSGTPPLQAALERWVAIARGYLVEGRKLYRMVPDWLGRDVLLFAGGGLAICDAIETCRYDVWTHRPTVTKWTKAKLLTAAILRSR